MFYNLEDKLGMRFPLPMMLSGSILSLTALSISTPVSDRHSRTHFMRILPTGEQGEEEAA